MTAAMVIRGRVVSGCGEGRYFVGRKEYVMQIEEALGFIPFPGTLNLQVESAHLTSFQRLKDRPALILEGFSDGSQDYGQVIVHPCRLGDYGRCAVVIPEKGGYREVMEVIAPHNLRERLSLCDGDRVEVTVPVPG
ncbi:MAG: DUF120 domain-containing protein [Thermoplasmatota archaeon]